MFNTTEWKTLICEANKIKFQGMKRVEVEDHPLKVPTVTERISRRLTGSLPSTGRTTPISTSAAILNLSDALEGIDPLTKFTIEEVDPLTQIASEMASKEGHYSTNKWHKEKQSINHLEPWSSRRSAILAKFTTSEKLSIITNFLSDGEKVVVKTQSNTVDKMQHRLEQLDYFEESSQRKLDVSQAEYVCRIEQLNRELVNAWNSEQRVKALKIAIQCAKLLSDTDVLKFYPSKFVLVTDILDIFGQLVYERLRTKADYLKADTKLSTPLPEDFTPDMVPEATKETCRNWFYKIASIRELVPRIYVEMAILKSYSFLTSSEFSAALMRLTRMIRGIGNPLVAIYARCYLCRVGMTVVCSGTDVQYLTENFYNFLDTYEHLFSNSVKHELMKQHIEFPTYLTLYTPALDFILQAVVCDATDVLLSQILEKCQKQRNNALLINSSMAAFKPVYVANRALQFLNLISHCIEDNFPVYLLLKSLGLCISVCPPPLEHRGQVLNIAWTLISNVLRPEDYIYCVDGWICYAVQYFSSKEVNTILGDLIRHLHPERAYENFYPMLKIIVRTIVSQIQDFEILLSMENFLPLIDLFQQETIKVEVCKMVISSCCGNHHTSDPVITNALMFLCTTLHDSLNALTVEDEQRQIGELLCNIVRKVDYGREFEQQLSFYVEARGAFSNSDAVLAQLVQCVNTLSVNKRQAVKGNHTRKSGAFVRACAAFCFITIPSIESVSTRLNLYLLSGQVALFNHCLDQADACFKAALGNISEISGEKNRNNEAFLTSYIRKFLSVLLVVPDSPDKGVLNLTRSLLNVIQNYSWDLQNGILPCLYMNVLDLLSTMCQEYYPYNVDKVESNDALYGFDPKFICELNKMCSIVLGEILNQLKRLGPCRQQSTLSLELIIRITLKTNLQENVMATLVLNLWQLIVKQKNIDPRYLDNVKHFLLNQDKNKMILHQLINKMNM